MLWDRDEQRLATLDKPNSDDPLLCVGFVGNTLCRVFWDDEIYRFSMKTWKESPLKAYGQRFVDTGAFSEDGSVLAIGDRRQLWLNSTRGSRQKKKRPNFVFPFDVNALAFDSGRQRMIAGGCARLLIHDMSDEAKDDEIELPDAEQFLEDLGPGYVDQSVRQLAFSSDGYWLAAAHGGGIFVLDLRSRKGKAVWRRSQKRSRRALAFSPCNRFFAAALPQWSIGVWRLDTLDIATTLTGHLGEVTALTFSPKGELLSGSTDGTVLVWDQHSYADEVASRSGR
jgi:WD40 repeat protein